MKCSEDSEDSDGEFVPDVKSVLRALPPHKRGSIARSLMMMGEQQQARVLGTCLYSNTISTIIHPTFQTMHDCKLPIYISYARVLH